jgi:5-methylcytosine-specific restriction endonuclease McrA
MDRCIVLNGDYTFLNTVNWKRAICLVIKEKAEVLKEADNCVRNGFGKVVCRIPLVIKLIKVIRLIYKNKVPFSKRNIMVRDNFKCAYCGSSSNLTIDHVVPTSQGGKNEFENCVTSCQPCNNKKGNRTPSEAKMFMVKRPYAPTISEFIRMKMKQLGVDQFLRELGVY